MVHTRVVYLGGTYPVVYWVVYTRVVLTVTYPGGTDRHIPGWYRVVHTRVWYREVHTRVVYSPGTSLPTPVSLLGITHRRRAMEEVYPWV